jgi:hypothetical protein
LGDFDLERSHTVHATIFAPAAESLAFPPEENAEETPDGDECGVGHDRGDEATITLVVYPMTEKSV